MIHSVLTITPKRTIAQIIRAIKEDFGEKVGDESVRKALERGEAKGEFTADKKNRPFAWSNT